MRKDVLLGLGLALGGCVPLGEHAEVTRTLREPLPPGAELRVQNRNGDVTIVGEPGLDALEIDVVLRAGGDNGEEARERAKGATLRFTHEGASVVVEPEFPGEPRGNDACRLTLRVPDVGGVVVRTSNGDITLRGTPGAARLDTSNGGILVRDHDGPVAAETSNGDLDVRGARGRVDARTTNGRVEFVANPAAAEAGFDLRTSNGSIAIRLDPLRAAGSIEASTSNGSIDERGLVDATVTRAGRDGMTVVFPRPGASSRAVTGNGSIRIEGDA